MKALEEGRKKLESFFTTVEKLLFDVVSWMVLIPKTLYLVLSDPRGAAQSVKHEMSENRGRFEDIVSPIFLYLLLALGPILLIQLYKLPKTSVSGVEHALVTDTLDFSLELSRDVHPQYLKIVWKSGDAVAVETCYYDLIFAIDCDDPYVLFERVVKATGSVDRARDSVAAVWHDDDLSVRAAVSWCNSNRPRIPAALRDPPQLERLLLFFKGRPAGCAGSTAQRSWDAYKRVVAQGHGTSAARDTVAALAPSLAAEWAREIYFQGPNPAAELFAAVADDKERPDPIEFAADSVSRVHDKRSAVAEAAYYCAPPPGPNCEASGAGDAWRLFLTLVEQDRETVKNATDSVAMLQPRWAQPIADFYCEPPADMLLGCRSSWTLFLELVEQRGYSATRARDSVAAVSNDTTLAAKFAAYWCAPPETAALQINVSRASSSVRPGCEITLENACVRGSLTGGERTTGAGEAGRSRAESLTASIRCAWIHPGTYRISAEVRDLISGQLFDYSESHSLSLFSADTAGIGVGSCRFQDPPCATRELSAPAAPANLREALEDTRTQLLAIVFLIFPLSLATLAVVFRKPPVPLIESIKSPFYVQSLFLAPFALAIWIRILREHYSSEVVSGDLFSSLSALLIIVLALWLLAVEIDFLAAERSIPRWRAFVYLLIPGIPVGLVVLVALGRDTAVSMLLMLGISKYDLVELIGYLLVLLMFLALVAGGLRAFVRSRADHSPAESETPGEADSETAASSSPGS